MRLFVAAHDPRFAEEVGRRWDEIAPPAPFRRVRPEGVHATFAFLGEVEDALLERIAGAVESAATGLAPFAVTLDRVGPLGSGSSTRVWVLRGASEAYEHAAGRLRRLLDFAAPAERRRPIPHVTLARSREPLRVAGRAVAPPFTLDVREITLFESFLEPGGARYVARHAARLGDGRPGM